MPNTEHDSDALGALIERLEKAEAGSRELDALVMCAVAAPAGSKVEQSPYNGAWCIYEPAAYGKTPFRLWGWDGWRRPDGWPITTSIDAIVSLIKKRLPKTCRPGMQQNPDKTWNAAIPRVEPDEEECSTAMAPTASLALCIAFLKALQSGRAS